MARKRPFHCYGCISSCRSLLRLIYVKKNYTLVPMTDTQRLADDCFFAYYVDDATDEKKTGQNNQPPQFRFFNTERYQPSPPRFSSWLLLNVRKISANQNKEVIYTRVSAGDKTHTYATNCQPINDSSQRKMIPHRGSTNPPMPSPPTLCLRNRSLTPHPSSHIPHRSRPKLAAAQQFRPPLPSSDGYGGER